MLGRGPVGRLVEPGAQAEAMICMFLFVVACMWVAGWCGLVPVPPTNC